MRIVKSLLLVVGICALLNLSAPAQEKSLYERLGGRDAITAVVDEFASRVLADERINKKFVKTDATRLKFELVQQICMVTGGPCQYTGRDMKTAHHNMKVTDGEFNALVEDLVGALNKFNVPEKEKNELLGKLAPLKPQIVEVNSNATGTPLPAGFKPAPPLSPEQMKMKEKKMDKKKEKKPGAKM
ncbi:MAG: group 1 truncated hemoglobin [Blastocatellia bacterium]